MKSVITIGRSSSCDIIIPHHKVSREHARISVVGGQYVYEDVGKNGSVIGGQIIHGKRMTVAAGTEILLAGKVPLPWAQVYSLLPLHGYRPFEEETGLASHVVERPVVQQNVVYVKEDSIGAGLGILSFLIPIVGWIMYFVWKDEYPHKASQACTLAWIGFAVNIVLTILASV